MSVEDERKLFVAGLDESATEQGLRELFESVGGTVQEVSVPRDRATGIARGFAFLTMATAEEARAVRAKLDGSIQGGRSISVREFRGDRGGGPTNRPSQPPAASEESTLYLGNLPFDCSPADVEQLFADNGFDRVRRVHLPTDADGRARGFGFVTLDSADSARRAADELTSLELRGRSLSVSVARARGAPAGGGGPRPTRPPMARPPMSRPAGPRTPPTAPANEPGPGFAPSFPPAEAGGEAGDARRANRWEKKKDKKRKQRLGSEERQPKKRRGGGSGSFRSTRADDYVDDWDDD